MENWQQIKEEYITGGVSYRELAARHGLSYGVLAETAGREGWVALKKQRSCSDGQEVTSARDGDTAEGECAAHTEAVDVVGIADKLLLRLSEMLDGMELDTQSVKQIASVLKDLRDIKEYPLETALQRAKVRKLERETSPEESGAHEIAVIFEAGSEAWNE